MEVSKKVLHLTYRKQQSNRINLIKMKNSLSIQSKLSNPINPHYFIFKSNGLNIITKDSIIIDLKPFESAKFANKYAKSIGAFSVFASHFQYEIILKNKLF